MFKEYLLEEIDIMTQSLKFIYLGKLKSLIKFTRYDSIRSDVENILSSEESLETRLKNILNNHSDLFLEANKDITINKAHKYSAIFAIEGDVNIDGILRNTAIQTSGLSIEKMAEKKMLKFTQFLNGIKPLEEGTLYFKTTYTMCAKFWEITQDEEMHRFVEITVDNVGPQFRDGKMSFFPNRINYIKNFIEAHNSLFLVPIDFSEVLNEIKKENEVAEVRMNVPKISGQRMVLSSGSEATLQSNISEEIVLPILGDLKQLIRDNENLFNTSKDIKELLNNFIQDTEEWSEFPWINLTWDNKVKSKSIQVKFELNNYEYTFLNYYHHKNGRERVDDVVKYLIEEYCTTRNRILREPFARIS